MKTLMEKLKNYDVSDIVKVETYKRFYTKILRSDNYFGALVRKERAISLTDKYLSIYGKHFKTNVMEESN